MSPLQKGYIGLPARHILCMLRKAGGKPSVFRTFHPNLTDGIIVNIIRDTLKYLPHLLGRGLWINQQMRGFNPFLECTQ